MAVAARVIPEGTHPRATAKLFNARGDPGDKIRKHHVHSDSGASVRPILTDVRTERRFYARACTQRGF